MIAMAHHASAASFGARENRFVDALVVELGEKHVTGSAHRRHRFHLRWPGSVIAMTGSAIRRGEISAFRECLEVDAGTVILKLCRWNFVLCHLLGIGVTTPASVWHP